MGRLVVVLALVATCVATLWLPPVAAQEQEGPAPPPRPGAAAPIPAGADAGPVAAAFEAALDAGDAAAAAALFAPDAQVKEHVAVLAAGEARVAAWVRDCLLPDLRLVPGSRRLGAGVATWDLRDALGCYWRARPAGFRPAWDVAPAAGTLTVAVAGGRIATLTVVYDPAWEARLLAAQAAPFRTAQAQATARSTPAAPAAGAGGAAWWAQPRDRWYRESRGTRPAATPVPAAPGAQDRRTPSVAPWLAALGVALAGVGVLALLPRPREAP
jgi:hypothetical protein